MHTFLATSFLQNSLTGWLKEMLIDGIITRMENISESVNDSLLDATEKLAYTPSDFASKFLSTSGSNIFVTIQNLSETVILPVAGIILTFVCVWELIQMLLEHNNMANFEVWMLMKWIFKTVIAILLLGNAFNFAVAVFDVTSGIVTKGANVISTDTSFTLETEETFRANLDEKAVGALFFIWIELGLLSIAMKILGIIISLLLYGRLVEIYLMVSLAPIPFATFGNREQSQIGMNYIRSIIALGLQAFLMLVCIGIYAVLVQTVTETTDIYKAVWESVGWAVLLAFTLFKTGHVAKSVMNAH